MELTTGELHLVDCVRPFDSRKERVKGLYILVEYLLALVLTRGHTSAD